MTKVVEIVKGTNKFRFEMEYSKKLSEHKICLDGWDTGRTDKNIMTTENVTVYHNDDKILSSRNGIKEITEIDAFGKCSTAYKNGARLQIDNIQFSERFIRVIDHWQTLVNTYVPDDAVIAEELEIENKKQIAGKNLLEVSEERKTKIKNGWCPKCESYCDGDCEA